MVKLAQQRQLLNTRCAWANPAHTDYIDYHDKEWGVPIYDDTKHFELLTLEGAQAGLSWLTILRKRAGYRQAFKGFDVEQVARLTASDLEKLCVYPGIVRNRCKIQSVVNNAQKFLDIQAQWGSFSKYIWSYVDGQPVLNAWQSLQEVPTKTPLSDQISQALKQQGFKFVGSTIIYAYLQAAGLVNDHTVDCFRYHEVQGL